MKKTLKKKRINNSYNLLLLLILYLVTKFCYKRKMIGGAKALKSFSPDVQPIIKELYKILKIGEFSKTKCEEYHPYLFVKLLPQNYQFKLDELKSKYTDNNEKLEELLETYMTKPYNKLKLKIEETGGNAISNSVKFDINKMINPEDLENFKSNISGSQPLEIIEQVYNYIIEKKINKKELVALSGKIIKDIDDIKKELSKEKRANEAIAKQNAEELCKIMDEYQLKYINYKDILESGDISKYFINLYEDLSGAVRVYVKLNEHSIHNNLPPQCPEESCAPRSYVQSRNKYKKLGNYYGMDKVPRIVLNNLCDYDMIYKEESRLNRYSKLIDSLNDNGVERLKNNLIKGEKLAIEDAQNRGMPKDIEEDDLNSNNNIDDIILGNYGITEKYGDFYSVFDGSSTNYEIYNGIDYNSEDKITKLKKGESGYNLSTKGLKDALLQVSQGYNITIFGYGYSGSGKTFTLLAGGDSKEQRPLIENAYIDLKQKGRLDNADVFISAAYELVGSFDYTKHKGQLESRINNLYVNKKRILKKGGKDILDKNKGVIQWKDNGSIESIRELLQQIETERKNTKTIKSTPNNPESSRSHLFIEIAYKKDDNIKYLTFIDMAGIENPFEIAISIFPFMDLRNKINPILNKKQLDNQCATKYKNLTPQQLYDSGNIPNKLYTHFNDVLEHMYWGDQSIASSVYANRYGLYSKDTAWNKFKGLLIQKQRTESDKVYNDELNRLGTFFWKPLKAPIQLYTYGKSYLKDISNKDGEGKDWLYTLTEQLKIRMSPASFDSNFKMFVTYYNDDSEKLYLDYPVFAKNPKTNKPLFKMRFPDNQDGDPIQNMQEILEDQYLENGLALSLLEYIKEIIYHGKGVAKIIGINTSLTEDPKEKLKLLRDLLNKILNNIKKSTENREDKNLPSKYYYLKYLINFNIYKGKLITDKKDQFEYESQAFNKDGGYHELGTDVAYISNPATISSIKSSAGDDDPLTTLQELYSLLYNYIYNSIILNGLYNEYVSVSYDGEGFGSRINQYIEKIIRGESTKASGATEVEFNYKPPAAYYYKTEENKYYKCIFKYRIGKKSVGGERINPDKYYIDDEHEITVMEGGEEFEALIKEGIFINETVNHITQYFQKKNSRFPSVELGEGGDSVSDDDRKLNYKYLYNGSPVDNIKKELDDLLKKFKKINNDTTDKVWASDPDYINLNSLFDMNQSNGRWARKGRWPVTDGLLSISEPKYNVPKNTEFSIKRWFGNKINKVGAKYNIKVTKNQITSVYSTTLNTEQNATTIIQKAKEYFELNDPVKEYHSEMISNLRSLVSKTSGEMDLDGYIDGVSDDSKSIMYDIINAIYDDLESNTDSTSIIKKNMVLKIKNYMEINKSILSGNTLTIHYYTLWLNFYLSYKVLNDAPSNINLIFLNPIKNILQKLHIEYIDYARDEVIYKELPNIENNIQAYSRDQQNVSVSEVIHLRSDKCNNIVVRTPDYPGEYSNDVNFNLYSYLPKKSMFSTDEMETLSYEKIKILKILDYYKPPKDTTLTEENRGTKYIMMCLIRPEIEQKFCTGTRATLDFAQAVCSTC